MADKPHVSKVDPCEKISLCSDNIREIFDGILLASVNDNDSSMQPKKEIVNQPEIEAPIADLKNLTVSDTKTCTTCSLTFDDRISQVSHYHSDWHRFNLKRKVKALACVSENEFAEITGDISSISGSGTDSDEECDSENENAYNMQRNTSYAEEVKHRHPKVFLRNSQNNLLSLYRCVVCSKKNEPETMAELLSLIEDVPKRLHWFVIMLAGGHFATAIFEGDKILCHKTLHRYVVRAKRGTAQSTHDNQASHAKSVGAFMRRHHEAALIDDIKKIFDEWKETIKKCDLIFLRASGSNRNTLLSGKTPIMDKKDPRIRMIPFPTRRPTFNEVKRVHSELSSISSYGADRNLEDFIQCPSPKKTFKKYKDNNKEKEEEKHVANDKETADDSTSNSDNDIDYDLAMITHVTNTVAELQPFECTRKPRRKRLKRKKPEKENAEESVITNEENESSKKVIDIPEVFSGLQNDLYRTIKEGKIDSLMGLLDALKEKSSEEKSFEFTINQSLVSKDGSTMLHLASRHGHIEIVKVLMEFGVDPTIKDKSGQFPYVVSKDKETRNEFRRFRGNYPEKFNYELAQIPSPLTKELEEEKRAKEAERRKVLKKIKKEKNKVKKEAERTAQEEELRKTRFLALSDREKRALAAERRLVQQLEIQQQTVPVISRCFTCAIDMTGKVPFEYCDNIFCTTKCLQSHRKSVNSRT